MPKVTAKDIEALGFVAEAFGRPLDFHTFLAEVIAEQAALLSARIGSAAYDTCDASLATLVKRAEKALVAAELFQRRFVRISSDINAADGLDALKLRRTRDEYVAEATTLIDRIAAGVPRSSASDYAGGVVESVHSGNLEWPA